MAELVHTNICIHGVNRQKEKCGKCAALGVALMETLEAFFKKQEVPEDRQGPLALAGATVILACRGVPFDEIVEEMRWAYDGVMDGQQKGLE